MPKNDLLYELVVQCLEDSETWWGDTGVSNDVVHLALSLAGEVGEFCNIIKKVQRGSLDPDQPEIQLAIRMELTDIFVYLLNLVGIFGFDLTAAFQMKRQENIERFTAARSARENRRRLAQQDGTGPTGGVQ